MKYFVIAGSFDQALAWANVNKARLYSEGVTAGSMQYVYGIETLKGIHAPRGVFIGTWFKRPDIEDILLQLKIARANETQLKLAIDYYYSEPA